MMQLIIKVVTYLTVMTDVAATITTPSSPPLLSPALSSSSHPVVASTPCKFYISQQKQQQQEIIQYFGQKTCEVRYSQQKIKEKKRLLLNFR